MLEKVNPSHPDKLCDRIAGALVDLAFTQVADPRIAVEVLLGHGICHIIVETDISLSIFEVTAAVERIAGKVAVDYVEVAQDSHLARNQEHGFRCGDNGIFRGVPVTAEQKKLTGIAKDIYGLFIAGLSPLAIAKKLTDAGIPSPTGREKWYEGTVRSILKNEKYKGCALLQKTFTPDFLTKKAVANDGTVPQYYVEDSHPAIIAPEQFALVQDIFAERARDPKHSGATIFSGKIRCGCCGGWYGSKVWHSNDKYRRIIWQCNHKFKDKTRCKTPHLTEDEIKAAFIRMVNKLYADREFYITELAAIKDRLGDTSALEKERRILDEQLGIDAKAVNDLIARNARVAQDQKEYNERYDALVSRYEETEHKRDAVMEQIDQIMIRRRKIERFIESVKDLPELITEFDESLWTGLVDSMTVHSKDRIVWKLTCGMEIES